MSNNTQLATTHPPQESPAVSMIRAAMEQGMAPEQLREFLAARREWEADEAKKSYYAAISEFQRNAPIIPKDDDAHGKQYARMDRIWRTIRPLFTDLGLSCTWQVCEVSNGMCHVEGELAHKQGHGVKISMDVALPELIRGQNLAQQVGSARTYAQRYAFCAATGIVTGEDDDGGLGGIQLVNEIEIRELTSLLDKMPDRVASFLEWLGVPSVDQIPAERYPVALAQLKKAAAK